MIKVETVIYRLNEMGNLNSFSKAIIEDLKNNKEIPVSIYIGNKRRIIGKVIAFVSDFKRNELRAQIELDAEFVGFNFHTGFSMSMKRED